MYFLGGREDNNDFNNNIDKYITKNIIPIALEDGWNYMAVQMYPLEKWSDKINHIFKNRNVKVNFEYKFRFNRDKYLKMESFSNISADFYVSKIDKELIENSISENLIKYIKIFWYSIEEFLEKGFGFCTTFKDEIVCYCISASVGGKKKEIGIATNEKDRNKGFATQTAKAFIDYCILNDYLPVWSTDKHNKASIRVAEKLGFEKIGEYPDYYFFFDEFEDLLWSGYYCLKESRNFSLAEEFFEKAFKVSKPTYRHYYNIACSFALAGKSDTAIMYLNKAIDNGWTDIEHMRKDEDLKSLHETKGWKELLSKLQKNWMNLNKFSKLYKMN